MYGLIGKFLAAPGKREDLIAALLGGVSGGLPGCLSYVLARDPAASDTIWVTEVWTDQASHDSYLQLPQMQGAIAAAQPLIAGIEQVAQTEAVGGIGLS